MRRLETTYSIPTRSERAGGIPLIRHASMRSPKCEGARVSTRELFAAEQVFFWSLCFSRAQVLEWRNSRLEMQLRGPVILVLGADDFNC